MAGGAEKGDDSTGRAGPRVEGRANGRVDGRVDGHVGGRVDGWTGWLLEKWRGRHRVEPRLALLERITLAPRQSLALIEAEGRRILVATSAEGGPAFYPLDENASSSASRSTQSALHDRPKVSPRVSW